MVHSSDVQPTLAMVCLAPGNKIIPKRISFHQFCLSCCHIVVSESSLNVNPALSHHLQACLTNCGLHHNRFRKLRINKSLSHNSNLVKSNQCRKQILRHPILKLFFLCSFVCSVSLTTVLPPGFVKCFKCRLLFKDCVPRMAEILKRLLIPNLPQARS